MKTAKPYMPELGQLLNGRPWYGHEAPAYIEAGLAYLGDTIERLCGVDSPMDNSGAVFSNDVFVARAYCWTDDCPQGELANFECGDIKVRWYKHCCRGATIDRDVSPREWAACMARCINSLLQEAKDGK